MPQDEAKLKVIIASLSRHCRLLLVVDQLATMGPFSVIVAQAAGIIVGYLATSHERFHRTNGQRPKPNRRTSA